MSDRVVIGLAIVWSAVILLIAPYLYRLQAPPPPEPTATVNVMSLVDWTVDGQHIAQRDGINLVAGDGIELTGEDEPTDSRVEVTIANPRTSGTVTLEAGDTSVSEDHDLTATTTPSVILTPHDDTTGLAWWLSSVTTTQFTVEVSATSTSDIDFGWLAALDK